jgi:hypothetical protein
MYKLYTRESHVEAVDKDDSDKALVYFGKLGAKPKFKQRTLNQTEEAYINKLKSSGYTYIGLASITNTGRLIAVDTFDTLYWELSSTSDIVIARFKKFLKLFVDIYQLQTKQLLSVVDEEMTLLIKFESLTIGIDISQKHNIISCTGKGCGQVSLSQSESAFWLLLYLHKNGCIKLSTTKDEIQSRNDYPSLVKEFSQSNKSLTDSLGLGCPFSQIKSRY